MILRLDVDARFVAGEATRFAGDLAVPLEEQGMRQRGLHLHRAVDAEARERDPGAEPLPEPIPETGVEARPGIDG